MMFSVVGQGRIGQALRAICKIPVDQVIRRGDSVPVDSQGPILIATTSDAVPEVYASLPQRRRKDAVFLANGMMLKFYQAAGISSYTQVLLYMSADDAGSVTDGKQTVATGPWATEVATALSSGGVTCAVLERGPFTAKMVEKLVWASTLWLVCHAHGGISVGEACKLHRGEIQELVYELFPTAHLYALESEAEYMQHYMSAPFTVEDVLEAIFDYSACVAAAVPSLEMARKEFKWRNGFFVWRQPTQKHIEMLHAVGCSDLVTSAAT